VFRNLIAVLFLCLATAKVSAVIESYSFDNEVQRARYQSFIDDMRCPKCQNQNLTGSDSPIAADLRRELHRLLIDGQSDKEIVDFMVKRYGDYVLYNPRLQPNTWALWFGPLVLLVLGFGVLIMILRHRRASVAPPEGELSASEQDALQAILSSVDKTPPSPTQQNKVK
jgi:cytochrome c-type biogenesis protein CcmH